MRTFTAVVEKCPDTELYVAMSLVFLAHIRKEKHWMNYSRTCARCLNSCWKTASRY